MLLLPFLCVGLFSLIGSAASQDDGQSPDNNVFNNKHGQTPCEMKDRFLTQDGCKNPASRRDDNDNNDNNDSNTIPTPTSCICTNVFFNLWSACIYTNTGYGNSTCNPLMQKCDQASLHLETLNPGPDSPYPDWAYTEMPPPNGTWNLVAAVESTRQKSPSWTTIQIVLPILAAVLVAAIATACYIYRRRRRANPQRSWMQTSGNRPRFQFPTLSSHQRVRELNRSSSWSIDEPQEDLHEYQFVSYPNSVQGSHTSGHVRLSSSSSVITPPALQIPSEKKKPVRTWPGKSLWKGPLQRVQHLTSSIPLAWKGSKQVKNVPGYNRFRVDASDSDSPLSQRRNDSLLGHAERSRSNLQNETIFEREENDSSDSDEEELPLIPEQHSRSNHDAEPPAIPPVFSPPFNGEPSGSQRSPRQVPPASSPPQIPLPLPPRPPKQSPQLGSPPPAPTSSQPHGSSAPPRLAPPPGSAVTNTPHSTTRSQRSPPTLPPAPTSPPPAPPTVSRRARGALPAQFVNQPPIPPSDNVVIAPAPPPPRRRPDSDGGSSIRSLPLTPTPPYVRAAPPAPIQLLPEPTGDTPPHSAPPYAPAVPLKSPPAHLTRTERSGSEATTRSVRRLPLPPGQ
ncbi:hypothetical protein R3P38DRAFT_1489617 [Favolaschia claudopus]|uniref:Uncharacterized protein n=1 Tax=Favolaschia claudopus TaxID=2862362 RepID=A0AAW0DSK2_9AGAR